MSRSYRKPVATDGYGSKFKKKSKQLANRAVRIADDVADGANYRRLFNSWNICDYKFNYRFNNLKYRDEHWYKKLRRK